MHNSLESRHTVENIRTLRSSFEIFLVKFDFLNGFKIVNRMFDSILIDSNRFRIRVPLFSMDSQLAF